MCSFVSFFRKKPTVSAFRELKVDMHSHLIPGIDDGSPDLATSLSLLSGLKNLGYEKVITTPHVMKDLYANDSKIIKTGFEILKKGMKEAGISLGLEVAAEYYVDRHFELLIEKNDVLSFGKRRFVLIEMSFVSLSPNLEEVIFSLITRGYRPILAHPERYPYLDNNISFFRRIADLGCVLQVNLPSLLGHYGRTVQDKAFFLVKTGFVCFLGTDLHHQQHLDLLDNHQFNWKISKTVNKYPFQNCNLVD